MAKLLMVDRKHVLQVVWDIVHDLVKCYMGSFIVTVGAYDLMSIDTSPITLLKE